MYTPGLLVRSPWVPPSLIPSGDPVTSSPFPGALLPVGPSTQGTPWETPPVPSAGPPLLTILTVPRALSVPSLWFPPSLASSPLAAPSVPILGAPFFPGEVQPLILPRRPAGSSSCLARSLGTLPGLPLAPSPGSPASQKRVSIHSGRVLSSALLVPPPLRPFLPFPGSRVSFTHSYPCLDGEVSLYKSAHSSVWG